MQTLEGFIRQRKEIRHLIADTIIIGPRASGKTSLASLWTNALTDVVGQVASYQWTIYQGDLCEFAEESGIDSEIDMERTYIPTLRIRVRDYPGEERFRREALNHIGQFDKKVVLILVLLVEFADGQFHDVHKNSTYYNAQFVHAIRQCLSTAEHKISSVFVVFNKSDLLPSHWDDTTAINKIKQANKAAIENIEQCFGEEVRYKVTSALTNRNIINVVGEIGTSTLAEPDKKNRLQDWIEQQGRMAEKNG